MYEIFVFVSGLKYMGKSMSLVLYTILKNYSRKQNVLLISTSMEAHNIKFIIESIYESCWRELSKDKLMKLQELYLGKVSKDNETIRNLLKLVPGQTNQPCQIIFDQFSTIVGFEYSENASEKEKKLKQQIFDIVTSLKDDNWRIVLSSSISVELKNIKGQIPVMEQQTQHMVLSFMFAGQQLNYLLKIWLIKCYENLIISNKHDEIKKNFTLKMIEQLKPGESNIKLFLNMEEIKTAARNIFFEETEQMNIDKFWDSSTNELITPKDLEPVLHEKIMQSILNSSIAWHVEESQKWIRKANNANKREQRLSTVLNILDNGYIQIPEEDNPFSGYLPLFLCNQDRNIRSNVEPIKNQIEALFLKKYQEKNITIKQFLVLVKKMKIDHPAPLGKFLEIFIRNLIESKNNSIIKVLFSMSSKVKPLNIKLQKPKKKFDVQNRLTKIAKKQKKEENNKARKDQQQKIDETFMLGKELKQRYMKLNLEKDQGEKMQQKINQSKELAQVVYLKICKQIQFALISMNNSTNEVVFSIDLEYEIPKCDGILIKVLFSKEPQQKRHKTKKFICEAAFYEIGLNKSKETIQQIKEAMDYFTDAFKALETQKIQKQNNHQFHLKFMSFKKVLILRKDNFQDAKKNMNPIELIQFEENFTCIEIDSLGNHFKQFIAAYNE